MDPSPFRVPLVRTGGPSWTGRPEWWCAPVRIEPRQHLLETWKATVATSWRDGTWQWGGRDGANSISDAEQLLCILLPATQVTPFAVDRPNTTADEMLTALAPLGDERTIPVRLVEVATDYFERYRDESGRPTFAGDGYYSAEDDEGLTDTQLGRDIVDSFAVSVTLALSTIGFVRIFRQSVTRVDLRERLRRLERLASTRLTAAMVGLLRSFSTHVFEAGSEPGRTLIATLNRAGLPSKQVVAQFREALRETIASFGEVLIGSGQTSQVEGADRLFECGWSWGVVKDAPAVGSSRRATPATTSATSRTAPPRTSRTCTSPWSPSTRSRTCSPSGHACSACSTRSNSGSPEHFSCGGT